MDLRATDLTEGGRTGAVLQALAFTAIAVLAGLDLAADLREGTTLRHTVIEGGIVLVGVAGLAFALRASFASRRKLTTRLAEVQQEAERWRQEAQEALAGLGAAIDRQLLRWQLTPAEREIARFLLKGLAHKEIADLRGVSEATVRQQARAIYQKAGVEGRHDLAAFFLTGL